MLAVLLLVVRMRVTWLKQGKCNPPKWMQMWMYCDIYAKRSMTLIVVVVPPNGEVIDIYQRTGDWHKDVKLS